MDRIDDRMLAFAAREGDTAAFEKLVKLYQNRAFRLALAIVRDADDARDICQDAFLRAYCKLDRFSGESQFYTWLYRIVVNRCLDHLRGLHRFEARALEDSPELPADTDVEREAERGPARKRIEAALAQLSPAHRTVLVLREVEGCSYQEIAQATGAALGTVMSRLFHARHRLKELLAGPAVMALAA